MIQQRLCSECGSVIDPERLDALPDTELCIACARKVPRYVYHDPNEVCAKASAAGRNGWAPSE